MARVQVTYLELRSLAALRPAGPAPDAALLRCEIPTPELNRFFYTAVGGDWYWRDRLDWTWQDWYVRLARLGHETWYALHRGAPAGYFELDGTTLPDVEIAYFGLLPAFVGRGLGGWLLDQAVHRGFALGAGRVWLHTCTLDGPAALPNYLARGFQIVKVDDLEVDLSNPPPGAWPGAHRPGVMREPG